MGITLGHFYRWHATIEKTPYYANTMCSISVIS